MKRIRSIIKGAALASLFLLSCSAQEEREQALQNINEILIENPAYGLWQDHETPPFRFEPEQIFGSETDGDGTMFSSSYGIRGPVVDHSGNVYLIDAQQAKLMSFTSEGVLRWETGQEGEGPGDFMNPFGFITDGRYLYMDNNNRSRIDKFDLEGDFIESLTWDTTDLPLTTVQGFFPDGLLVTTSTLWGRLGAQVNILDLSGGLSVVSQFDIRIDEDVDLGEGLSAGININVIDSLIVAGNNSRYQLQFFDRNGDLVKVVQRSFDHLVRPGFLQSGNNRGIRVFSSLNAPFQLENGYLLTHLHWPVNVNDPDRFIARENPPEVLFASSLDLYDETGTLLYSLEQHDSTTPEIGAIVYVDGNGKIYTKTDEPYPQLRRYSIQIMEEEWDNDEDEVYDNM